MTGGGIGHGSEHGIVIGGGGSVAVGTAALFSAAHGLDALAEELEQCLRDVTAVDGRITPGMLAELDAPVSALRAERALDGAAAALGDAARTSEGMAAALQASAVAYGFAEDAATRAMQSAAADLAVRVGLLVRLLGPAMLPGLLVAVVSGAAGLALARAVDRSGTDRVLARYGAWAGDRRRLLSDPRFVELVRYAAMSVDDGFAGASGVPAPINRLLGDEGVGLTGLDTAAATVAGMAGTAGALRDGPVRVSSGSPVHSTVAGGFADRAARIPQGPSQVRVDRLIQPGRPDRFEVYIAGTADFAPVASDEPWDLTSNVAAISGGDAASYRAVEQALEASGATADSPIAVTGYSQGGLVAAMLAASGDHNVTALYTLGAPAGQVDVPHAVPWVAVEHTDDIVPAVGGTWASADPLLVRREVFVDRPPDGATLVPAHRFEHYRETAALTDSLEEQRVVDAAARFDDFTRGVDRVESTLYTAERIEE